MEPLGGGLGVDHDGSQTNFESSMNYTLEEYAMDRVVDRRDGKKTLPLHTVGGNSYYLGVFLTIAGVRI